MILWRQVVYFALRLEGMGSQALHKQVIHDGVRNVHVSPVAGNWKEGRKVILLMRATNEVDGHVNVWSEKSTGLSSTEAGNDVFAKMG